MPISLIRIDNFRNLTQVELRPGCEGINVISGINGSGKTSLLEAIYYLGHNRSFRSANAARIIKHNQSKFSLYSQVVNDSDLVIPIGVERHDSGASKLKVNESDATSIAELSRLIPIRVINSQSHSIFESGPAYRRKYLDWGLFFQDECFLPVWRQYERVLKQRNMALKARCPKEEFDVWTQELVKHGLIIDKMRRDYICDVTPHIIRHARALLGIENLHLNYYSGWDNGAEFADVLAEHYFDERRLANTQYGPHRADFDTILNGITAQHFLSRGQQKLLICAMMLAQGSLLLEQKNKAIIYLVDDLPSELDVRSREKLVDLLAKQKTQIFITSIESESICTAINSSLDTKISVFHVEHGTVCTRTNL